MAPPIITEQIPTTNKMTPTALTLKPVVVTVTANLRTAPMTTSTIPRPIRPVPAPLDISPRSRSVTPTWCHPCSYVYSVGLHRLLSAVPPPEAIRGPTTRGGPVAMTAPRARRTVPALPARRDGTLTRAVVLSAALELIDRDGADGLSMRRLARELGCDPMTLYRHAPNKAALRGAVAETVLAELEVAPAAPDGASQLRQVARQYRRLALAHPN